jgi:flagellar basal body-associated protein FliL
MAVFVMQMVALVAVVLSFMFAALVFTSSQRPAHVVREPAPEPEAPAPEVESEEDVSAADTMTRVLEEIERLASLRERGVLTDKEFASQKTKLLQSRR